MAPFTAVQRAELRDAIARSRIDAEKELAKLRSANRAPQPSKRKQPAAHALQAVAGPPIATPLQQKQPCIYCGRLSLAPACHAHNDLLKIDIPENHHA